jgi:TolB protein
MTRGPRATTQLTLVVALFSALIPAGAALAADATHLVSQRAGGGFPNGPSFHPALSQDRKAASLFAFDSVATDIVAGDANGMSDVFVVRRAGSFKAGAKRAGPWSPGAGELVSTGMGGQPADGPSFLPDLDGDQSSRPHCVAFLSDATNLVPGDTNGKTDAFVKDLTSGLITRVSVSSAGAESDGAAYDVQVDGACDRVAFTSDASNLAFTQDQVPKPRTVKSPLNGKQRQRCRKRFRGRRALQRKRCKFRKIKVASERTPAVTTAPPAGTKQVYVRVLGGEPGDVGLVGLTFLASASTSGQAGNGNSFDAVFGDLGDACPKACGTTSGDAVAFTSEATNLTGGDGNGALDVYERTFRIPTQHFIERRAKLPAYMRPATRLVSSTGSRQAGNGPSDQPAVNDSGRFVGFRTAATDLFSGDSNGVTDVVYADMSRSPPKLLSVSFAGSGSHLGNGASSNPTMSRSGSPVLFQTDADNLTVQPQPDRNCITDVLFWGLAKRRLFIQSLDSDSRVSGNPANPADDPCPDPATTPATNPASSYYANYMGFEDANPLLDLPLADQAFPGLRNNPQQAATMANSDPGLHQVYVHFVGP